MSHSTVLVIKQGKKSLATQLAPFDEGLKIPHIISREELIAKSKKEIEDYKNGRYAEFLADPVKYKAECSNEAHLNYIENEFPKKLEWTDDQLLEEQHRWYEDESINEDGSVTSNYNPNSKWDWYQVGGRWAGTLICKPEFRNLYRNPEFSSGWPKSERENINPNAVDSCAFGHLDFEAMKTEQTKNLIQYYKDIHADPECYAYRNNIKGIVDKTLDEYLAENVKEFPCTFAVLKNGVWYEKGQMHWFAIVTNEDDDWDKKFKELISDISPETIVTIVDVHI